jgi:hypothetical protein
MTDVDISEGTSSVVFEELDADITPPCDFTGRSAICKGDPASWILWSRCPNCLCTGVRLACETCRTVRLGPSEDISLLCTRCEHVITPARHAYYRCEKL